MPIGRPPTVNTLWVPGGISATAATTYLCMANDRSHILRRSRLGGPRGGPRSLPRVGRHPAQLKTAHGGHAVLRRPPVPALDQPSLLAADFGYLPPSAPAPPVHTDRRNLGSRWSRMPSPSRLKASTVIVMARPGNSTSHQGGTRPE